MSCRPGARPGPVRLCKRCRRTHVLRCVPKLSGLIDPTKKRGFNWRHYSSEEAQVHSAVRSRRSFLRARMRKEEVALRPPWAVAEDEFVQRCTRCDACVSACPTGILIRADGGFPAVDFTRGECTFCGECLSHCEPRALLRAGAHSAPWAVRARIGERCLAQQGVECRVCGENCPQAAIRFRLRAGGVALPELDVDACTGCGACVAPCPTRAILVCVPAPGTVEIPI